MLNRAIVNIDFGNLLVGCNKEEQANKTLKLKEIEGIKVVSTSRVGGTSRTKGRRGIITGVPLNISIDNIDEIKSNLKGGMI